MNSTKKLQLLLVLAAVLCAIGIAASLFGGDAKMPTNFRAPWWISAFEWLAFIPIMATPAVAKQNDGITHSGFPASVRLQGSE